MLVEGAGGRILIPPSLSYFAKASVFASAVAEAMADEQASPDKSQDRSYGGFH